MSDCPAIYNTWREAINYIRDHHISLTPVHMCQCGPTYHDIKATGDHLRKVHNLRVDGLHRNPIQVVLMDLERKSREDD